MDFAAIDFETANYYRSSICSIGIAVVKNGLIVKGINKLVKPAPEYYSRFTTEIHGLSYKDTCNEPYFPQIWNEIKPEIDGLPLVAHNKSFDENVLKKTFEFYSMDSYNYHFYCTLQLSRKLLRNKIDNHKLPTVCRYLNIPFDNHHDALSDAIGCAMIYLRLSSIASHMEPLSDL